MLAELRAFAAELRGVAAPSALSASLGLNGLSNAEGSQTQASLAWIVIGW